MNNKKRLLNLFIIVALWWALPFSFIQVQENNLEKNINNSSKEIPTANPNGYLHFYEDGTIYEEESTGVDFLDLERDEDIQITYDYFIDGSQYESFILNNGKEKLNNISFFLTDNREGFIYSDKSWTMSVNQDDLIFDEKTTGSVTLKSEDFSPLLDKKQNNYVLKVFWGIDGTDQASSFLFANTDSRPWAGYETITLHFNPDKTFYDPEIWFETGTDSSHDYFKGPTTVHINYDLPYGTKATNVYLGITDLEDSSFVKTYNVGDIVPDFNLGAITWTEHYTYFTFVMSELPDAAQYYNRSKFKFVVSIDWETNDDSGNVIESGYTDTEMSDKGNHKYLTYYFEDLYMDLEFNRQIVTTGSLATLEYSYRANRSGVSFFANRIDLVIDRVNLDDDSIEDTLTTELINRGDDEDSYIIGYTGNGTLDINTSDTSFFIENKKYEVSILVEDLRYDHWSFLNYEWSSDKAYFILTNEDIVIDVKDQDMQISSEQVNYGDDIVIDYSLNNFTSPYLVKYNVVFKEDEFNSIELEDIYVNDYTSEPIGSIVISYDEYKDYINEDWNGKVYVNYSISNDIDGIDIEFESVETIFSFINTKPESENSNNKYLILIIIIFLILITFLLFLILK